MRAPARFALTWTAAALATLVVVLVIAVASCTPASDRAVPCRPTCIIVRTTTP